MLTKSVKSVISVVLKHVARAKKIRAIGVIREYNIRMVLLDNNIFICTYVLAVSTTRANSP